MKPSGIHVGTYTVLTEDDNQGTAHTKVVFGQKSPYEIPYFTWSLILRATLSHQWMVTRRKSEIHPRTDWDSISAPFILSYLPSLATSCYLSTSVKTCSNSSSKRLGAYRAVNSILHAKTLSHLPDTIFVSTISAFPRREQQEYPQAF